MRPSHPRAAPAAPPDGPRFTDLAAHACAVAVADASADVNYILHQSAKLECLLYQNAHLECHAFADDARRWL